jgi:chromosome segregation ATPase
LQIKTLDLLQQQQLVLESQSRVQTLDEVLQKRTIEYEQLLQQSADEIAQLKLDHDSQLQQVSQAFAQQVEEAQRSLQMKNESDLAIQAEAARLENLRQQLEEYRQHLDDYRHQLHEKQAAPKFFTKKTQQSRHFMDSHSRIYELSRASVPAEHDSDFCDSENRSACSERSSTSPTSNILRTHEQLPRTPKKQPAWDNSQTSRFTSGKKQRLRMLKKYFRINFKQGCLV